MHSRNYLKMRYFTNGLSKNLWKSKIFFGFWIHSQKVPGTVFKIDKYVPKFFSLVVNQEVFEFFQKLKLLIYAVHFMIS